tara:strand:- start:639 stop:1610 length:972 start_codon:yes stop_codon:yes gene_type:complete
MKLLNIFLLIPIFCFTQSYNGPESIEANPINDSYFISNSNNGQILELDNNGNLSVFTNGLNTGPHGLELVAEYIGKKWTNQILYACSGGKLYGFDIEGNEILDYNLNGSFLNGITQRTTNQNTPYPETDLFITDFSDKKLYRYNITENTHDEICSFSKNPNGIYYDNINDRLIVVFWGWNAPICEIDLENNTYNTIVNTGLSNLDGIAMDPCGNFYVSAWSSNAIHQYNMDFTENEVIINGLSNPADIYYDQINNILAIPNSGNNTVDFVNYSCQGSSTIEVTQNHNNIIKTIDLLGRNMNNNQGYQIDIYDNGNTLKKYVIK